MVPSALVLIDAVPLTSNGKLDRRALPDPEFGSGTVYVAPRTRTEALVCRLFAEITGADGVGIRDNLFELGGDSISAMRLVSLCRREGLALDVRDVFAHPSPRGLADCGVAIEGDVVIEQGPVEGPVALFPIHRMFLDTPGPIERFLSGRDP